MANCDSSQDEVSESVRNNIAFVFPGQGSQYVGMGKDLYENYRESKEIFKEANEILGFDLKKICFVGPEEELKKTKNTQVAVLTVSIASLRCLEKENVRAQIVAGHSLGEYTALVSAHSLKFSQALTLVRERATFMEDCSFNHPGTMVAIIGLDSEEMKEICAEASPLGMVEIANFNSPYQTVLSGEIKAVEKAAEIASQKGAKRTVFLKLSGPFHSRLMEESSQKLALELEKLKISPPQIPLIANYNADYVKEEKMIKEALIKQISSPVQWVSSIRKMLRDKITTFIEIGPGRVLSGLIKKIDKNVQILNVEDVKSLQTTISKLSNKRS